MKPRRAAAYILAIALAAAPAAGAGLTAAEYVRLTLASAPEVRQAEEALFSAESSYRASLAAAALPSASLSGTDVVYGDDATSGSFHGLRWQKGDRTTTTGVNWNLFNGFKDFLSVRSAAAARDSAAAALRNARESRGLAAIGAFYRLVANKRLVDVAKVDLAAQEDQFRRTETLYRSGIKGLSDLYKSETEWRSSQVRLISAEASYKSTLEPFNTLIDRDPWAPTDLSAALEPGTTDLPLLAEDAARLPERLPDLTISAKSVERASLAAKQSILGALPSLTANASWTRADAEGAGLWTGPSSRQVGVALSLPFGFNGFNQYFAVAVARSAERSTREADRLARRSALDELYAAWIALESATKIYGLALRQEEIAAKGLEIVEAQYNQGSTDALRMAQARTDVLSARVQTATALQNIYLNRAAYRRAAGVPLW